MLEAASKFETADFLDRVEKRVAFNLGDNEITAEIKASFYFEERASAYISIYFYSGKKRLGSIQFSKEITDNNAEQPVIFNATFPETSLYSRDLNDDTDIRESINLLTFQACLLELLKDKFQSILSGNVTLALQDGIMITQKKIDDKKMKFESDRNELELKHPLLSDDEVQVIRENFLKGLLVEVTCLKKHINSIIKIDLRLFNGEVICRHHPKNTSKEQALKYISKARVS